MKKKRTESVEYCDNNFPETMEEFRAIQRSQLDLFAAKQRDYGPNNIYMNGDTRLSLFALLVRINDKLQRMFHLHKTKETPQNEPIIDCYQDVSIYGIIAQIVSSGHWGK